MKLQDFLEYLWARPATSELAQSLATVYVERGRFDLVPVPGEDAAQQARRELSSNPAARSR